MADTNAAAVLADARVRTAAAVQGYLTCVLDRHAAARVIGVQRVRVGELVWRGLASPADAAESRTWVLPAAAAACQTVDPAASQALETALAGEHEAIIAARPTESIFASWARETQAAVSSALSVAGLPPWVTIAGVVAGILLLVVVLRGRR